jgi:hypothetical protein
VSGAAATVELRHAWPRTLGIVAIGLGFVAAPVAYLIWGPAGRGSFAEFVMYVGILFGAVCTLMALRTLAQRGPVVSIGPQGVFDRRLSTDWVPWSAVAAISTAAVNNQRFVMLELNPEAEASLPLKRSARTLSRMNAGMGLTGYAISATTLAGGFDALEAAIRAHAGLSPPG